jgi:hypothetical protein
MTTSKPKGKKPCCGLCGKVGKVRETDCCGNWICDDQDKYVPFSYSRNSCNRNHDRYTLCGSHYNEGHSGLWKDCDECRKSFNTEMYVWYIPCPPFPRLAISSSVSRSYLHSRVIRLN